MLLLYRFNKAFLRKQRQRTKLFFQQNSLIIIILGGILSSPLFPTAFRYALLA